MRAITVRFLLLLCALFGVAQAWAPRWVKRAAATVSIAALSTGVSPLVAPVGPAQAAERVIDFKMDSPSGTSSGGLDAFEAASKAFNDPKRNMKAPSTSDYLLVQEGKKELSNAPRASKRRALGFCKDGRVREQTVPAGLTEKECINRVMTDDYTFILEAEKELKKK